MMRAGLLFAFGLALITPLAAQTSPRASQDNPRIQSVSYADNQTVRLTAMPRSTLTVILEPNEVIERVAVATRGQFDVSVSPERNAFQLTPLINTAASILAVETNARDYRFEVETGMGLMAAYLVRFEYEPEIASAAPPQEISESSETWSYRVSGHRSVRPDQISDDGMKTQIVFDETRALPAVFAIGPTGDEEVVNGFMRDGVFVIDRVYEELVFRIDKDRAKAKRRDAPEQAG